MRDSEQQQKTYQCECGQIFDNPQKFNAHKSWCRIHLGDEKYSKGIFCDSSWELAFVIWCIDHELNIERNSDWFEYDYEGKRLYSPDFKIDGIYFEIKNFYSDKMKSKIQQFPQNKTLVIIDSSKIKPYIEYAINIYGNEFIRLYDRHYSSWMDQE